MVQMSQVLEYAHKTSSPQTRKIVEAMAHHAFRRCSAPFATLDQTVSALKGDVPGGSLERLGERHHARKTTDSNEGARND
jgi:hypothetical protein